MQTHRARAMLAATVAGLTLTACGGGHSGHDNTSTAQAPGSDSSASASPHAGMAGMNMADVKGDGLEAAVEGYTLSDVKVPETVGKEGTLEFTILGPTGKAHKEFLLELTKLMHMYVVRKDLTEFQHVHPTLDDRTGRWSVPITFTKPGPYRLVTEFQALKPDGYWDNRVLGKPFTIDGSYKATPWTPNFGGTSVDGYDVSLDKMVQLHGPDMTLKITQGGAEVKDIQPYLQSWAHVTGFRQSDLKVVHMHPNQGPGEDPDALGGPVLNLASLFSTPGKYRLFVQFQTAGTVHTAPVDVEVMDHQMDGGTMPADTASPTPSASMPGMTLEDHEKMGDTSGGH